MAHGRDRSQDPYLTEGNRQANDLAFDCAKQSFQQCATDILPEIKNAVRLQVHLINTFYTQSGNSPEEEREQASGTQDSRGFTPRCSCVPGHRFRKKGRMFCTCPASQSLSPDLNVEHFFLNLVDKKEFIPDSVWSLLKKRYPSFAMWIDWRGPLCHAQPSAHVIPSRQRKLPLHVRELISQSLIETGWSHGPNQLLRYTPWAFFLVEFVAKYGWVRGFLFPELGFATLVQRFRCHWIHFAKEAFSDSFPEISSSKIGGQFGLVRLKAFGMHLSSGFKTALWTILIQASLCDRLSTRAWKPDWNLILA